MKVLIKITFSLLFLLSPYSLYSQTAVVVAGGNIESPTESVAYSLGQIFYITLEGEGGSVTQGVEQPHEITDTKTTIESTSIGEISFYPNPAKSRLTISFAEIIEYNLRYSMVNINGEIVTNGIITDLETSIDLKIVPNGAYFVNIIKDNKTVESIKFIKEK